MKSLSVKEVAAISGVSVRTLHYYDQIDLLKPSVRTKAGYRLYDEKELLQLQQILFFRELDVSLKQIGQMISNVDFDMVEALAQHKQSLKKRKARIERLLSTIDNTIDHLKEKRRMKDLKELYEGLPKEYGTTLRNEAINKYGKDTIEESEKNLMIEGKQKFVQFTAELNSVIDDLFEIRTLKPEHEMVQEVINKHYQIIRKLWGTSNQKDTQKEAYSGLGKTYEMDERYLQRNGMAQPEFAKFVAASMKLFADKL